VTEDMQNRIIKLVLTHLYFCTALFSKHKLKMQCNTDPEQMFILLRCP